MDDSKTTQNNKPSGKRLTRTAGFSHTEMALLAIAIIAVCFAFYETTKSYDDGVSSTQAVQPVDDSNTSKALAQNTNNQPAKVYITPSNQTLKKGASLTVEIRENSGTTDANAIQANLTYPSDMLTLINIDQKSSAFPIVVQNEGSAGMISMARGIAGNLKGDNSVAKLTFRVNSKTGTASLKFGQGTALVSSSGNKDLLKSLSNNTLGATYTIR
jgi:hypothetical protein